MLLALLALRDNAALAQDPAPEPAPAPEPETAPAPVPAPAPEPAPATESPPVEAPAPAPSSDRDEALLGGTTSDPALEQRLDALEDRLTIGGRLWLQTTAYVPDGVSGPSEVRLDAPNLLDLFADARPNDRVRAWVSGRLIHDWTIAAGDIDPLSGAELRPQRVILDQLWTKFDIGRRVFVTAGRQRIRWGASRFWNPTDFLNQQRLDPLAIFDVRTGVDLLKVHVPFERAGANVYLLANLADSHALDEVGGAARVEWAFGSTELTASAAIRKDQPRQIGADLSSGLGPLDVRVEVAASYGVSSPGWEGRFDPGALPPVLPDEVDRSEQWWLQTVAGADVSLKLSSEDSLSLGVEYFHNPLGTDDAALYPWRATQGQFTPLYLGRDYAAVYALLPGPGRWDDHTFTVSALGNLTDRSVLGRFDWRATWLTWLESTMFVVVHGGENGELHYRFELPKGNPLFPDGLLVPAPLVDVGLGAVVRF